MRFMHLETVKRCIDDSPCISFEQYFMQYVLDIQDKNINYEMQFLLRNSFLDSVMMSRIIEDEFQGYVL